MDKHNKSNLQIGVTTNRVKRTLMILRECENPMSISKEYGSHQTWRSMVVHHSGVVDHHSKNIATTARKCEITYFITLNNTDNQDKNTKQRKLKTHKNESYPILTM